MLRHAVGHLRRLAGMAERLERPRTDGAIAVTHRIESLCLYLLLVVIALRPLIPESYNSARSLMTSGFGAIEDPSPAATLVIDAFILLAAAGFAFGGLARGLARRRAYRRCGIEWGLAAVALGGLVSCWVAGNKRIAINATVDWLCLPLLTIVLVQLLRQRWHLRLVLCVVLSSAAVQAYECFNQVLYSFPATKELYEQNRERIWAERDVELDSPQVALYERRLDSGEATGFLSHGNVTGAYLVMTGLAALAVAWSRWRSPPKPMRRVLAGAVAILGVVVLAAAGLTHSKGAAVAGVGALVVWCARQVWAGWIERNRIRTLWLGWGLVIAGALAAVGYGLHNSRLPGASLNFRWQYWTASAKLLADRYATGVGRENFGRHYLKYKTIDSPEEVSNPHNFLVNAAAEWGVIGLVGVVVMLVGGSIAVTRRQATQVQADSDAAVTGRPLLWGLGVGGAVFFVRLFLLGSSDVNYLFVATFVPVIVWAVVFALLSTESDKTGPFRNGTLPGLAVGINCCLLAFLVQEGINFAVFIPGAATTFFAMLAIPIADYRMRIADWSAAGAPSRRRRGGGWILPAVACVVVFSYLIWIVLPVGRAGAALTRARAAVGQLIRGTYEVQPAYVEYARAAALDGLDPTPPAECAGWLIRYAEVGTDREAAIERSLALIDTAIARDPLSTSLHRQKMRLCREAYRLTDDSRYNAAAIAPARRVVELYPQSPEAHADLGTCLLDAARESPDAALLTEAMEHLRRALELDDARPSWEELRRFRPRQRKQIESQIAEASGLPTAEP